MKKKLIILTCIVAGIMCLTACHKQTPQQPGKPIEGVIEQLPADELEPVSDSDTTENEEAEPIKEPEHVTVTMDEFYSDTRYAMHLLGLQQYPTFEGESYSDIPEDGKEFLILFLQIENRMEKDDYFNVEMFEAAIDGKAIENTFLVNEPLSYTTIFNSIPAGKTNAGFVAWQVPKDWQTLEITYHGWKGLSNVIVHASLTPDDLKTPPAAEEL